MIAKANPHSASTVGGNQFTLSERIRSPWPVICTQVVVDFGLERLHATTVCRLLQEITGECVPYTGNAEREGSSQELERR